MTPLDELIDHVREINLVVGRLVVLIRLNKTLQFRKVEVVIG